MSIKFDDLRDGWDAILAIDTVTRDINDGRELTPTEVAQRELERGFPFAAKRLVSIAMHSPDDKIARLAANDVIHHNFTLAQIRNESAEKDGLRALVEGVSEDDMTEIRRQVEESKAASGLVAMEDNIPPSVGSMGTGALEDYDG